ncbi:MAG: hypothetical protein NW224_09480 [Leptolyngbyaceae cyanobacterium bins.302]|nr:hypothetical protein [Leptolyngbyaceae cyanobacterium bins.302]
MAKVNGAKTEPVVKPAPQTPKTEDAIAEPEESIEAAIVEKIEDTPSPPSKPSGAIPNNQDVDESLNALKALLSAVEKLQKVRQEVGDIKPLLVRMLDGEVVTGDELEQLKAGVGGLFKLVRAYSDHQTALTHAQAARELLDQVLKSAGK